VSPFCKPKPKVVRLFLGISLSDLGNQHGARMTVAAVSAPTAASTGEDMSMGASQVAENVSPQVVMVTGKPVCAQASAYDPGGFFAALSSPR
jgi:hypothetical protein